MLEAEEKNIINIDPKLISIDQTIGIPIESQLEDKVIGILQIYNTSENLETYLDHNQQSLNSLSEYLSTLIQQSVVTR